eukprot:scaffold5261_cov107-Isochrysis_galbana.AAC.1
MGLAPQGRPIPLPDPLFKRIHGCCTARHEGSLAQRRPNVPSPPRRPQRPRWGKSAGSASHRARARTRSPPRPPETGANHPAEQRRRRPRGASIKYDGTGALRIQAAGTKQCGTTAEKADGGPHLGGRQFLTNLLHVDQRRNTAGNWSRDRVLLVRARDLAEESDPAALLRAIPGHVEACSTELGDQQEVHGVAAIVHPESIFSS